MPNLHTYETPKILHDAPLRPDDTRHFHFDQFAVTLCRLIADKTTRTPLTIGVSGSWGSGKTTLLQGDLTVDVAIIGGGYTGLATAYFLKQAEPALRVAVLEGEVVGYRWGGPVSVPIDMAPAITHYSLLVTR